ncbi:cation diffusion facilitator family transporter [soil metagenome]
MAGSGHGNKAIIAAFFANLGIAISKFFGFIITGSGSMLAEGVHSVADTGNQALLLLGGRKARRPASPEHPFGYGRERYFWSFVVAMVLFALGSAFALYEGFQKLRHPHEIESPELAIGILAVAIVLESLSFRTAIRESRQVKGEASWWQFVRRAKIPELPVVLLEDLGALLGLVIAMGAVTATVATDDTVYDASGTLVIGVLLGIIAAILAVEMKGLLIGESASPAVQQRIQTAIEAQEPVRRVIHLRTQHLGPEELLVGAKIEFVSDLSVTELSDAVNRVETAVREAVPAARVMYLEPDVMRTADSALA